MALKEDFEAQGAWLFRWRSFLPLFLLPVLLTALLTSGSFYRTGSVAAVLHQNLCLGISLLGIVVRALVLGHAPEGTSGRNKRAQKAVSLNTTGAYAVIRHPLYFGNFLIYLGIFLFTEVWWLLLLIILAFWLYYERIIFTEEEFLRKTFGDSFLEWAGCTPAFLPQSLQWVRPPLSFSFRNVLRLDSIVPFETLALFVLLDLAKKAVTGGPIQYSAELLTLFGIAFFMHITVYILKKKTTLFVIDR